MSSQSFEELQQSIRKFCDDRDWDQFHNPKDLSISLSLEASEVLEHFQWMSEEDMRNLSKQKIAETGDELADVLYWVLLLANKLNIDLVKSFDAKMAKNAAKYPVEKAKGNSKKYTEHAS